MSHKLSLEQDDTLQGWKEIAGDDDQYDHDISTTRAVLGEEAFAAAWNQGQAMTLDETIAYALHDETT